MAKEVTKTLNDEGSLTFDSQTLLMHRTKVRVFAFRSVAYLDKIHLLLHRDKLRLIGQNLCRVFKSVCGCACV